MSLREIYFLKHGGGGEPAVIESLEATENGIYVPRDGVNGFAPVKVAVSPSLEELTAVKNGVYESAQDGYSTVTVAVPEAELEELTATENRVYLPTGDGFSKVTVDVAGGGYPIPESALNFNNKDCSYLFAGERFRWFLEQFVNRLSFQGVIAADYMFDNCKTLDIFPAAIDFNSADATYLFSACEKLTEDKIPTLTGEVNSTSYMFNACRRLKRIPERVYENLTFYKGTGSRGNMFRNCEALREAPMPFINQAINQSTSTSSASCASNSAFNTCSCLDEVVGLAIPPTTISSGSSLFANLLYNCHRLKRFTFETNEDGSAKVARFKGALLSFEIQVGYTVSASYVTIYMPEALNVLDDATYQQYKDTDDWFTTYEKYSRYNHDSAVETINSLPDTSAYGSNTIKFRGSQGSATDGGAINTLTEAEIAVAAAKGWSVTFVN